MTPLEQVYEFTEANELPRPSTPELPDFATRKLRKKLLREEYNEYLDGEDNDDLVEIADALCDILYIVYGTGITYGLPMKELFDEVHRSNMSKLGEDGTPIRREDGKILKGPNYFKPDLASIVDAATNRAPTIDV
jgi:predicted HAD superfamily Cof-like phosphohydrolase